MKRLLFTTAIAALLAGCGNSWEMMKKDWKSDFSSLKREVVVYDSVCGKELWRFTGVIFVSDMSKPGDIKLIYRDTDNKVRKNDYIGRHIAVSMKEVD